MIQKVIKVGSSAAVTIPKKAMSELGIKTGDMVSLDILPNSKGIVIRTKKESIESDSSVTSEVLDWTKKFIERYRSALDDLSNK